MCLPNELKYTPHSLLPVTPPLSFPLTHTHFHSLPNLDNLFQITLCTMCCFWICCCWCCCSCSRMFVIVICFCAHNWKLQIFFRCVCVLCVVKLVCCYYCCFDSKQCVFNERVSAMKKKKKKKVTDSKWERAKEVGVWETKQTTNSINR